MGFWHTGYMEFHDVNPPGVTDFIGSGREWIPEYRCVRCGATFDSPRALENHSFEGHGTPVPVLLFRGLECGRTPVVVTDPTRAEDWVTLQCDQAWMNARAVDPEELPSLLAAERFRTVTIKLAKGDIAMEYVVDFSVADPDDLDGVDGCLDDLARARRLDLRSIEAFIQAAAGYASAVRYVDGIANYFYGVLAREGSPESGLRRAQYRERYDVAASTLVNFDRGPAQTIAGLVAFHYNQFDAVRPGTSSPRLVWAARRLEVCLRGHVPDVEGFAGQTEVGLDRVLSDAETERVLRWSSVPLDSRASSAIREMEGYLRDCEPFDRLKLRIVVAEVQWRVGNAEQARRHAQDLRNNDASATWANSMLGRIGDRD